MAKHPKDEVLELIWEILATCLLPVLLKLASQKQIVKVLIFFGFLERENALNNNEEDDSGWEHIDLSSIVGLAFFDLGCHVGHCASVRLEFVDSLVGCKTKVSDFQIQLIINEDVF